MLGSWFLDMGDGDGDVAIHVKFIEIFSGIFFVLRV